MHNFFCSFFLLGWQHTIPIRFFPVMRHSVCTSNSCNQSQNKHNHNNAYNYNIAHDIITYDMTFSIRTINVDFSAKFAPASAWPAQAADSSWG